MKTHARPSKSGTKSVKSQPTIPSAKAVLLIIDGLGDLPTPKTSLQAAKKPNLDRLAKMGCSGLMSTISPFIVAGSDTSHLNLLGYDPKTYYGGRGPLEALGLGMDLRDGDVAFRANFATIKDGVVTDRRAGRIDTKTAAQLAKGLSMTLSNGIEAIFKSSVEHRGALILRGYGLSEKITPTDPHGSMEFVQSKALTASAQRTADAVNEFTEKAFQILSAAPENKGREKPANILLLRGAGMFKKVPTFTERFGIKGACVAGGALYKGVARFIGMDVIEVPGATSDAKTDLKGKAEATLKALETHDFVLMHVKGCDSAGHDGDFQAKKKMVERIDKEAMPILMKALAAGKITALIVSADHSTPCIRKAHSGHDVPVVVYGKNERVDLVKKFDEMSAMQGGLGHIKGKHMMPMILNLLSKAEKYGS